MSKVDVDFGSEQAIAYIASLQKRSEAIKQASKNLAFAKICLGNEATVENRACYQWCLELIHKLSTGKLQVQDWMLGEWAPKGFTDGKIEIRIPCPTNSEITTPLQPPFQLEFKLWYE